MQTVPFTYLIGWSQHHRFYYGVRFAKGCGPETLWKTYFTSSKSVSVFRQFYGEPDIIQVRKTFATKQEAVNWEIKVLRRMKIPNRMFLNLTRSLKPDMTPKDGVRNGFFGKKHTEETKTKMRKSHRHLPTFLGKQHTEETKRKIGTASTRYRATEETKRKIGTASKGRQTFLGRHHCEETKKRLSELASQRPKLHCYVCYGMYTPAMLSRWHNEKCRSII